MSARIQGRGARRAAVGAPRCEHATVLSAGIPPDLLVFLVFLLLPILGRVLRSAQERAQRKAERRSGSDEHGSDPAREAAPQASERQTTAADVEDLERSGADLWRRLLEGLDPEAARQPEVVPVPPPAARVEPRRSPEPSIEEQSLEGPSEEARERPAERSLERPPERAASEPVSPPVETLPETAAPELQELATVSELSDSDHDLALLALFSDESASEASAARLEETFASSGAPVRSHWLVSGARDELRRAVLWSEVLAPPLALRAPAGLHADWSARPSGPRVP